MKRFLISLLFGSLSVACAWSQQTTQLLDAEGLKAANDSILAEAYQLYLHEKVAWTLEDVFGYSETKTTDSYGGWIPVTEDGVIVKGVFFDEEKKQVIFEASVNIQTGEVSENPEVRDLTPDEIEVIDRRRRQIDAVMTLEDRPNRPEDDAYLYNVNVLPLADDLYRVYFMLGTAKPGIIPFGSDFSYDCDAEGNVKAFRKYHKSCLPLPVKMEDGSPVEKVFHTHLDMCPLMAPTDIALYLLYGYELAEIKESWVYSPVYQKWFVFDPEEFEIRVEDRIPNAE